MVNNRFWTEEETKRAIELFYERNSASKIAAIMNKEGWRKDCPEITRNAIVGLLHRNDCSSDKLPKKAKVKKSAPKIVKPKKEIEVFFEVEEDQTEKVLNSSIVDLLSWQCRFPVGELEAEDFHFCSEQIDYSKNKSYCAKHYSLCYYPARRQLDAAKNP